MQSLTFNIVPEEALQDSENQKTYLWENGTCDPKNFLPGVHWCVETGQWWLGGQLDGREGLEDNGVFAIDTRWLELCILPFEERAQYGKLQI